MKITNVEVFRLELPAGAPPTPHRPSWADSAEVANPLSGYPRFKAHRDLWYPKGLDMVWCRVTLADGTYGLGATYFGWATAGIIRAPTSISLVIEHRILMPVFISLKDMAFNNCSNFICHISRCWYQLLNHH